MMWSDASIIYRAEHYATRSELRPGIIVTEPDGTTSNLEMNPNLYFSEGQLSALRRKRVTCGQHYFGRCGVD
jgi:DNA repair protein SbcC/Rad50